MTALATVALLLAGFAALAGSMHTHHRDLFGAAPQRARIHLLRCTGWSLLTAALVPAIKEQGAPIGIVLWFGAATVAALAVAGALSTVGAWKKRSRSIGRECDAHAFKSASSAEAVDP